MSWRGGAAGVAAAATFAAVLTLGVTHWAQRRYERAVAFRIARTTASYIAAVTPPPPPPPAPRRAPPRRGVVQPPPQAPPAPIVSHNYHLPSLLTQARALRTLPGWTTEVEVYYGTAPLIDATAAPLTPDDLHHLDSAGGRWRREVALVPLKDTQGREVVGAVAARPLPLRRGPLPGGMGFAFPAALLTVGVAVTMAIRQRPLRRGGYIAAALLLAAASYIDLRTAARQSTDRWLTDTRRLLQEAATRMPAPRARVTVADLAALVRDAELVPGEAGESAPQRVQIDGEPRAVVAVLIGPQRWVELRTEPAEIATTRWLVALLGCACVGPAAILLLRWGERTPARRRRETAVAWGFLAPAVLHLLILSVGPALFVFYLGIGNIGAVLRDPLTWNSVRTSAMYVLYVPLSIVIGLGSALAVHRYRGQWGGRLLHSALFLPYLASVVAVGLVWQAMYQAGSLGLGRSGWLNNSGTALLALMIVSLWAHVGGQMVVFLMGLQRIPEAYLDAARVDGASAWSRFRRITLPLLRPVTWFVLVTGLLSAIQAFTLVYVLTAGGPLPQRATDVVVHHIYQTALGSRMLGLGSALASLLFIILLPLAWAQLRLLKKQVHRA